QQFDAADSFGETRSADGGTATHRVVTVVIAGIFIADIITFVSTVAVAVAVTVVNTTINVVIDAAAGGSQTRAAGDHRHTADARSAVLL
ncbi:MAG: hypothetical protein M3R15_27725, partial [Acidobacteriota bacterium]|nr:hypothetical protein [Acidobacteriota bacterium]